MIPFIRRRGDERVHDAAGRARQRAARALHDAVAGTAHALARVVARGVPPVRLFPGQNPINPVRERQINRAMLLAAQAPDIAMRVSPHRLRHSGFEVG